MRRDRLQHVEQAQPHRPQRLAASPGRRPPSQVQPEPPPQLLPRQLVREPAARRSPARRPAARRRRARLGDRDVARRHHGDDLLDRHRLPGAQRQLELVPRPAAAPARAAAVRRRRRGASAPASGPPPRSASPDWVVRAQQQDRVRRRLAAVSTTSRWRPAMSAVAGDARVDDVAVDPGRHPQPPVQFSAVNDRVQRRPGAAAPCARTGAAAPPCVRPRASTNRSSRSSTPRRRSSTDPVLEHPHRATGRPTVAVADREAQSEPVRQVDHALVLDDPAADLVAQPVVAAGA